MIRGQIHTSWSGTSRHVNSMQHISPNMIFHTRNAPKTCFPKCRDLLWSLGLRTCSWCTTSRCTQWCGILWHATSWWCILWHANLWCIPWHARQIKRRYWPCCLLVAKVKLDYGLRACEYKLSYCVKLWNNYMRRIVSVGIQAKTIFGVWACCMNSDRKVTKL